MSHHLTCQKTAKFAVLVFSDEAGAVVGSGWSNAHSVSVLTLPRKYQRVYLDIDEEYTRCIIKEALESRGFAVTLGPGVGMEPVVMPADCDFQWSEYERIDWSPSHVCASSFRIRKGLSRKAQMAFYINRHIAKHADSLLKRAIPQTIVLDTWPVWEASYSNTTSRNGLVDAVFGSSPASSSANINQRTLLEQCLAPAKELFDKSSNDDAVWILKGSTVNKGVGIYIIHIYEQVLDICWTDSDIREWVLQRYISSPLTLRQRKFHIRAYIVTFGALTVYFCNECLVLMSATAYRQHDYRRLGAHITNTAFQSATANFNELGCVQLWGSETVLQTLVRDGSCRSIDHAKDQTVQVLSDMQQIVSELFSAYESEYSVFSPMDDCFEHFGLDFLVDSDWQVYLLEVNPGPDFKQTGIKFKSVIDNLMKATIDLALMENQPRLLTTGSLACIYENQRRMKETQM